MATIHSCYGKKWAGAEVVAIGYDSLTGQEAVYVVRHRDFAKGVQADFYVRSSGGKHFNVGSAAFWITLQGE